MVKENKATYGLYDWETMSRKGNPIFFVRIKKEIRIPFGVCTKYVNQMNARICSNTFIHFDNIFSIYENNKQAHVSLFYRHILNLIVEIK